MSEIKLDMRLKQALRISPQLLQSTQILQMNAQNLREYVDKALEENPVLDKAPEYEAQREFQELCRQAGWISGQGVRTGSSSGEDPYRPEAGAWDTAMTSLSAFLSDQLGRKALSKPLRELCRKKLFWVFMLMMLCAGAAEQAVSQWSSAFAEQGLGVSKTVGDLAGPMAFAAAMGISRALFGRYGGKLDLGRYMQASALLCIAAYGCIVFVPSPVLSLIGCAVTGFSVGIFWPGTFSRAAASIRGGGTAMFALLALAGDLGCAGGPTLAGLVSSACGGSLRAGILAALIFPALMLVCLLGMRKTQ